MPMQQSSEYRTIIQLEAGIDHIMQSPQSNGRLEMIVARPKTDERMILQNGRLNIEDGLEGDNWKNKAFWGTKTGLTHPEMQITLMNSRVIQLIAGDQSCWPAAGDQLYVDLDLGIANLPPGTRLQIGSAIVEITNEPHTGCKKFANRYGMDAVKFVNSVQGRQLNLRGVNAKVIAAGDINVGDAIKKLS